MQFWDIAGQERTKVLSRNYYNGASACIIVFDITNSKSYEDVKEWKAELDDKLGQIPTIVLANKVRNLVI
jgi:small GTP-binding protein